MHSSAIADSSDLHACFCQSCGVELCLGAQVVEFSCQDKGRREIGDVRGHSRRDVGVFRVRLAAVGLPSRKPGKEPAWMVAPSA